MDAASQETEKDQALCRKLGCVKLRAKNQGYCSREHAPYGNYGSVLQSVRGTRRSTSRERGGTSVRRSIYAPREATEPSTIQCLEPWTEIERRDFIEKTLSDHGRSLDDTGMDLLPSRSSSKAGSHMPNDTATGSQLSENGRNGMQGTGKETITRNMQGGDVVSLDTVSRPQLDDLEKARSESMSLIDESAKQLHELMKSVPVKGVDTKAIAAACNCASQIHKLIRLKFDIAKTAVRQ